MSNFDYKNMFFFYLSCKARFSYILFILFFCEICSVPFVTYLEFKINENLNVNCLKDLCLYFCSYIYYTY